MINFLIQHDLSVMIITSIIIGLIISISNKEDLPECFLYSFCSGSIIFLLTLSLNMIYYLNNDLWNRAAIIKTIPREQIQLVELPNHYIEVWAENKKYETLADIQDILKKDKIDHIEYRHIDLFGPDYNQSKIIYKN